MLTRREQYLIIFVLTAFLVGGGIKYWRDSQDVASLPDISSLRP